MNIRIFVFLTAFLIFLTACFSPQTAYAIGTYNEQKESQNEEKNQNVEEENIEEENIEEELSEIEEPTTPPILPLESATMEGGMVEKASDTIINKLFVDISIEPFFLYVEDGVHSVPLEPIVLAGYDWSFLAEGEIVWRYEDFDDKTPGRREIIGDVILPEGFVFEDKPLTVKSIIIVYDSTGAPFISINNCKYTLSGAPIIIPQGATESEVVQIIEKNINDDNIAVLYTEDRDIFIRPYTIDINLIDTSKLGAYYPITLDLPDGITFDGSEFWMIAMHVIPSDEVNLSAVSRHDSGYVVQWFYEESEPTLWVSKDDEDWQEYETQKGGHNDYGGFIDMKQYYLNGLKIKYQALEAGYVYRFQVQYDGDRFSDILVLDFTNSDIPKLSNEKGGDRNGIDREENITPPIEEETIPPPPIEELPQLPNPPIEEQPQPPNPPIEERPRPTLPTVVEKIELILPLVVEMPMTTQPPQAEPPMTTQPPQAEPPMTTKLPEEAHPTTVYETQLTTLNPENEQINSPATPTKQPNNTPNSNSKIINNNTPYSKSPINETINTDKEETRLTISGHNLLVMTKTNPNYVSLVHNDMWVSIPTLYLQNLQVTDTDRFTIRLEKPDEDSFLVEFSINQIELEKPFDEPFLVSIPWQGSKVSCISEDGTVVDAVISGGKAVFSLIHDGVYRLSFEEQAGPGSGVIKNELPTDMYPDDVKPKDLSNNTESSTEKYKDGFMPIVITCGFGLLGTIIYLGFSSKKRIANTKTKCPTESLEVPK